MNFSARGLSRPREWVTPHKVSLAVLVTVYAERELPETGHPPSPVMPVLVTRTTGASHGSGRAAGAGDREETVTPTIAPWPAIGDKRPTGSAGRYLGESGLDCEGGWSVVVKRNFAKSMLKWIQSSDMEFQDLLMKVKEIDEELSKDLLETLSSINTSGLSALADFIQSLHKLLDSNNGQSPVHRHSILGIFIRRMVLSYDKLSFDQVSALYKSLKAYLSGLEGHLTEGERSKAMMDISTVDDGGTMTKDELDGPRPKNGLTQLTQRGSTLNLPSERTFTRQQAESFIAEQARLLQNDDPRALDPSTLQDQIAVLKDTNPDLAETHFLSYLNGLRLSEFCGATDSLHSYFDHLLPRAGEANSGRDEGTSKSFRYAALNLAGMHCMFGHREQALLALKEAIRIAHERNDNVCLQHALGWLYRLEKMSGEDVSYLLDRSITRSDALNLPYLASLGIQNFAQHKALSSTDPSNVFEYLAKSDMLNCKHNQPQLVQTSLAQQSALWQMYGYRTMSSLCDQLLLHSGHQDLPGGTSNNCLITTESEVLCLAICNQARQHGDQGMYTASGDLLRLAKERFPTPSKHAKIWMECEQELSFDRAILQGKWQQAEQAVLNLASINETSALYRKVILLKKRGETTAAFKAANHIIDNCKDNQQGFTTELLVRALLELSELHAVSSNHTSAIPHLLESLALCQTHHLSSLYTKAMARLAQTQLMLKMPRHALSLVERIMPQVLANGSLYDQCCVKFLYAKCQVACSSRQKDENRKAVLLSVVQLLQETADGFHKTEAEYRVKDVIYLQAHLYDKLGYTSERNKCSLNFRQLDHQYPTSVAMPTSSI
ncbi:anaphase-promoting complex subunit 5-like [Acanthaster planci]|uniref:Anaphase-promoting complex subunit 5 n=1 Tax=Acanthaster planci TaxID=133434 RepID=A0A8B7XTP6_ACAPL|nr:anaphase-promoting complex subunit 5-like [Acanthaster planci]